MPRPNARQTYRHGKYVASIAVAGFERAVQQGQSLADEDNCFSFVLTVDHAKTAYKTAVRRTIEYGEQFFQIESGAVGRATPSRRLKQNGQWNRRR
jgi:hypothetical protein